MQPTQEPPTTPATHPFPDKPVRLTLAALSSTLVLSLLSTPALAEQNGKPAASAAPTTTATTTTAPAAATTPSARRVEVRLALSATAAETLGEKRLRRLFEIELDDTGSLAQGTTGPLSDQVAHVWIDQPSPSQVLIEARLAERPVTRRTITIEGLNPDVAARLVAITANELVRAQARPTRPRKPPAPRTPTAKELEKARRAAPALVWSVSPNFLYVPSIHGTLFGPGVSLGFRGKGASERIFGRWLSGPTDGGASRIFEIGVALDYRLWLSSSIRLALGAETSLDLLRFSDVRSTDQILGETSSWSARAGGLFGVDVRAWGPTWIGLHLAPSAMLQEAEFVIPNGQSSTLQGFALGVELSLQVEHLLLGSTATTSR